MQGRPVPASHRQPGSTRKLSISRNFIAGFHASSPCLLARRRGSSPCQRLGWLRFKKMVPAPTIVIDGSPAPEPPETITRDARGRATVRAIKLTEPLRLDGKLDEEVYRTTKPFGGMLQVVAEVRRSNPPSGPTSG